MTADQSARALADIGARRSTRAGSEVVRNDGQSNTWSCPRRGVQRRAAQIRDGGSRGYRFSPLTSISLPVRPGRRLDTESVLRLENLRSSRQSGWGLGESEFRRGGSPSKGPPLGEYQKEKAPPERALYSWIAVGRLELPRDSLPTSTSSLRVYQFPHDAMTPDGCLPKGSAWRITKILRVPQASRIARSEIRRGRSPWGR